MGINPIAHTTEKVFLFGIANRAKYWKHLKQISSKNKP
jgi:hypothetical protein